jgi:hypothetical protein
LDTVYEMTHLSWRLRCEGYSQMIDCAQVGMPVEHHYFGGSEDAGRTGHPAGIGQRSLVGGGCGRRAEAVALQDVRVVGVVEGLAVLVTACTTPPAVRSPPSMKGQDRAAWASVNRSSLATWVIVAVTSPIGVLDWA